MPEIYHNGTVARLTKRGRYYLADWTVDGERHRRSTGSTELTEAREIAVQLIERSGTGIAKAEPENRLSVAAKRMWREKWRRQSAGPQRMRHIEEAIEIIGDLDIRSIDRPTLIRLRDALEDTGISPATVNRKLLSVRSILGTAETDWEVIDQAPKAPLFQESEGRHRYLSQGEIEELLETTASDEWRFVWSFLIETGLRKGELLQLQWNDFDLEGEHPTVTVRGTGAKSKKTRSVPLEDATARTLSSRLESGSTRPFDVTLMKMRLEWDRCRAAMGLKDDPDFVIHALRHTCATQMIKEGVPAEAVRLWLGHSSLRTTQRYVNLVGSDLRQYTRSARCRT